MATIAEVSRNLGRLIDSFPT
ncbi:Protein of unknown function [Thermobacillus xylanilyticus]|uniref:Uncharacterized protein n=1 Tax=Thermobacillus xylanilyticus TaxID=76633 RepID=A0ABM8V904_THEXY|nr:Protein of unknown function [Thermobacillus xylanilyticus]